MALCLGVAGEDADFFFAAATATVFFDVDFLGVSTIELSLSSDSSRWREACFFFF